jgi:hypothetical protein
MRFSFIVRFNSSSGGYANKKFAKYSLSEIRLGGLTKDLKTNEKYYNERDKDVV